MSKGYCKQTRNKEVNQSKKGFHIFAPSNQHGSGKAGAASISKGEKGVYLRLLAKRRMGLGARTCSARTECGSFVRPVFHALLMGSVKYIHTSFLSAFFYRVDCWCLPM